MLIDKYGGWLSLPFKNRPYSDSPFDSGLNISYSRLLWTRFDHTWSHQHRSIHLCTGQVHNIYISEALYIVIYIWDVHGNRAPLHKRYRHLRKSGHCTTLGGL
jgi:hypothetical protein